MADMHAVMIVNKTAQIFAQENLPTLFLHDQKSQEQSPLFKMF